MLYVQCKLKDEKNHEMVTWLPQEKGIGKGALISLKDVEGKWRIEETYSTAPESAVMLQRDLYRHHRKATDI